MLRVSRHALERHQAHHPDADHLDVLLAIIEGQRIDGDLAMALMGRCGRTESDVFVASRDSRGIYVITGDGMVVTYVRLVERAVEILRSPSPEPARLADVIVRRAVKGLPEGRSSGLAAAVNALHEAAQRLERQAIDLDKRLAVVQRHIEVLWRVVEHPHELREAIVAMLVEIVVKVDGTALIEGSMEIDSPVDPMLAIRNAYQAVGFDIAEDEDIEREVRRKVGQIRAVSK